MYGKSALFSPFFSAQNEGGRFWKSFFLLLVNATKFYVIQIAPEDMV